MGVTNGDPSVAEFNEEEAASGVSGSNVTAAGGNVGETILATAGYDVSSVLSRVICL